MSMRRLRARALMLQRRGTMRRELLRGIEAKHHAAADAYLRALQEWQQMWRTALIEMQRELVRATVRPIVRELVQRVAMTPQTVGSVYGPQRSQNISRFRSIFS